MAVRATHIPVVTLQLSLVQALSMVSAVESTVKPCSPSLLTPPEELRKYVLATANDMIRALPEDTVTVQTLCPVLLRVLVAAVKGAKYALEKQHYGAPKSLWTEETPKLTHPIDVHEIISGHAVISKHIHGVPLPKLYVNVRVDE